MANLSKEKRDRMLQYLESLKAIHNDDASIKMFNEIEDSLNEKKYGLVFEEHTEEVDELLENNIPILTEDKERILIKDVSKPMNFIIEGDNLQALYLLDKTHRGKVDCIYIDPPYNTGARDWKYNNDYVDGNDSYRHSKWLSMMKRRLQIAKRLLNPLDSVLICTIDEKEYLHIGCLLEELFPNARIQMISSVINRKGVAKSNTFSRCDEYIFFVMIGQSAPILTLDNMLDDVIDSEEPSGTTWLPMRRAGTNSLRKDRPKLCYPIIVDVTTAKIIDVGLPIEQEKHIENQYVYRDNVVEVWPIKANGDEGRWQLQGETVLKRVADGTVRVLKKDNNWNVQYLNEGALKEIENGSISIIGKDENGVLIVDRKTSKLTAAKSVWNRVSHDATTYGTNFISKIIGNNKFSFPKSLYAVFDTINFFVSSKKNATVLDFFAGSGTTQHAVNLLNALDGGNRKCIMITNNEVSDKEEKLFTANGLKKGDDEWESHGIAKYVTWPRTICSINGVNIDGKPLNGTYLGTDYDMSTGFISNIKFLKCDWTPRKPDDHLLSNVLMMHIKEMIELQNAIQIDNVKNVLILNKNDVKNYLLKNEIYDEIENIWINQNIILNSDEMKLLKKKNYKYVPKEFFGDELKEAAE